MLKLSGVGKRYGRRQVLRDVNFTARPGIWLLTGPNGAGKSTLLGIMAGLVRPSEGAVQSDLPPGGIGYLGHAGLLYPQLTALENLLFWTKLHRTGAGRDACLDALEAMDLLPHAHDRAATFSRGMWQRLSLARLFLLTPRLLLLDEPGTGLDGPSRRMLAERVVALGQQGVSVVWVSHQEEDRALADGVFCLADGKLSEELC